MSNQLSLFPSETNPSCSRGLEHSEVYPEWVNQAASSLMAVEMCSGSMQTMWSALNRAMDYVDAARLAGAGGASSDVVRQVLGDRFVAEAKLVSQLDEAGLRTVFLCGVDSYVPGCGTPEVHAVRLEFASPEHLITDSARVCYRSEEFAGTEKDTKLVRNLISRGHGAMLEFSMALFEIDTDRGITHELVRHRLASFAQESTRYCDYDTKRGGHIGYVSPTAGKPYWDILVARAVNAADTSYHALRAAGAAPQFARAVLPTCTASRIRVQMNLRSWLNFLHLRDASAAHPDMQIVARKIKVLLRSAFPVVFAVVDELTLAE